MNTLQIQIVALEEGYRIGAREACLILSKSKRPILTEKEMEKLVRDHFKENRHGKV